MENDLWKIGYRNWKALMQKRDNWCKMVEVAKVHNGLYSQQRRMFVKLLHVKILSPNNSYSHMHSFPQMIDKNQCFKSGRNQNRRNPQIPKDVNQL